MLRELFRFVLTGILLASPGLSWAATLDGTWKLDRAADYYGRGALDRLNRFDTLIIKNRDIRLAPECMVHFGPEDYYFSDVFQPLVKADVTEGQVDRFLTNKFGLTLSKTRTVYSLTSAPATCAGLMMEFFQVGERILVPMGATFYSYVKVTGDDAARSATSSGPSLVAGYMFSRLPMDFNRYFKTCRPKILDSEGHPRTTEKCAPDFFPYVADPKRNDQLMNIIGNHDYAAFGQRYTEGFSPPFEQKLPATFLVFPPKGRVTLVRVDDFDIVYNEQREVMSGVYLSIVNGRVVDQLYGCDFDKNYVCMLKGSPVARLLDSGKFERIPTE